ncbi:MAG: flagellar operon protein [Clostridiales bacterium]|nr:flagellar operon protein [Clostridiales bacterium]
MDDIQFKKNYAAMIPPNYSVNNANSQRQGDAASADESGDFAEIFNRTLQQHSLTFSKHAMQRMDSRQISVSPQSLSQISQAVENARSKGIQDALIVKGQTAFLVNVPSGTVITAMNGRELAGNVFTNIDGAVIL